MPDEPLKPKNLPQIVRVDQPKEPPKEVLERTFTLPPDISQSTGSETRVTTEDKSGNMTPVKVDNIPTKVEGDNNDQETVKKALQATGQGDAVPDKDKPRDGKTGQFLPKDKEEPKKVEDKSNQQPVDDKKPTSVLQPPKKKEGEVKADAPKAGEVVKQIGSTLPDVRDYSGFNEEETRYLRQTSNEGYQYFSKLLKDNKNKKESSIYSHPEAYTLDPQYKTLQRQVELGTVETQCYQAALQLCEEGKPFRILEKFDEKGNPVFSEQSYEASAANKIELTRKLNQIDNWVGTKRGEMNAFGGGYQGRVKGDLSAIEAERSKRFAWNTNPEILEHTVPIQLEDGSFEDRSVKTMRDYIINLCPPYMRNHPFVDVAADMFAALVIQGVELHNATKGQQQAEVKRQEAIRAEPTSDLKPAPQPEPVGGVREFSLKGSPLDT